MVQLNLRWLAKSINNFLSHFPVNPKPGNWSSEVGEKHTDNPYQHIYTVGSEILIGLSANLLEKLLFHFYNIFFQENIDFHSALFLNFCGCIILKKFSSNCCPYHLSAQTICLLIKCKRLIFSNHNSKNPQLNYKYYIVKHFHYCSKTIKNFTCHIFPILIKYSNLSPGCGAGISWSGQAQAKSLCFSRLPLSRCLWKFAAHWVVQTCYFSKHAKLHKVWLRNSGNWIQWCSLPGKLSWEHN